MHPLSRPHRLLLLSLLLVGLVAVAATGSASSPVPEAPTPDISEARAAAPPPTAAPPRFSNEKAGFAVKVKDEVNPYRVLGVFVMPGERLDVEAVFTQRIGSGTFDAATGTVTQVGPERWTWTAPGQKGLHPLHITDEAMGETITLNAFVMVPFGHRNDALNGYRIGRYAQKPLRGNPVYNPPRGFVEVTPENRDVRVAPHFTVGQFLCKQAGGFPKYLILRERLLLKLEMILEAVNDQGVDAPTLHVMSGFRTPYYNQSIGNRTTYSRHLYGGAADIFVDADQDGRMDDLDGDGRVTTDDARVLARIVERQADDAWYQPFLGGLGIYSPKPHRGPFVHVDVRGHRARW